MHPDQCCSSVNSVALPSCFLPRTIRLFTVAEADRCFEIVLGNLSIFYRQTPVMGMAIEGLFIAPLYPFSPHLTIRNDAIASQQNEEQKEGFRI